MRTGWIKVHRKVLDNFLYQERRVFSKFEAWFDILLNVNYQHGECLIEERTIECERGQSLLSMKSWGERWSWDKSKVNRFLKVLKEKGMIELENLHTTTRLTVVNYEDYNAKRLGDNLQHDLVSKSERQTERLSNTKSANYRGLRNAEKTQMKRKRNADETQMNTIEEEEERKKNKEEIQIQEQPILPIKILEANTEIPKEIPAYIQRARVASLKNTVAIIEATIEEAKPKQEAKPVVYDYAYQDQEFKNLFNDWVALMKETVEGFKLSKIQNAYLNKDLLAFGLENAKLSVLKSIQGGWKTFYSPKPTEVAGLLGNGNSKTYKGLFLNKKIMATNKYSGAEYQTTYQDYLERKFITGVINGNFNTLKITQKEFIEYEVSENELRYDFAKAFGYDTLKTQIELSKKTKIGNFMNFWEMNKGQVRYSELYEAYHGKPVPEEQKQVFFKAHSKEQQEQYF